MTVDVTRQSDGRRQLTLGPVEWWIVGLAGTALLVLASIVYNGIVGKIEAGAAAQAKTAEAVQAMATQQAVTSGQITTLTAQLADIPAMRSTMAEVKVKVDRHEQDIKELRGTRGLR